MAEASPTSELKSFLLARAIILWRHKWLALAICWAVCIAGWTVVLLLPRQYESSARVYVNVDGLLAPLLKGMVINTSPGQNEEYLRQTLLSRPNLQKVIVLAGLDSGKSTTSQDALIDKLSSAASVHQPTNTRDTNNLVTISYDGPTPAQARNVVQALVTIFAETASSSSRVGMAQAQKFLERQIAQYGAQLQAAEQRRAEFQRQYADFLPDPTSGAPRVQILQAQVDQAKQDLDRASITRNSLQAQVRAAPQLLSVTTAPLVGPDGKLKAASPQMRLDEARRNLAELRLQYTDSYPDVVAARRDVAELENRVKSGTDADSKTQISNPVYEQMRLKLVDAETSLPAAAQRYQELQAQLAKVKSMAGKLPEIQAQGKNLDRDYDVIKTNYDELVKRREAASLSQAADDQADRTQFRIVDPPSSPLSPSFPNIPLMVSVVFLLGIGAGIGVPLGISFLRPTFASMDQLRELGLPVIGHVTIIHQPGEGGVATRSTTVIATLSALVVVYAGLIALGTHFYR